MSDSLTQNHAASVAPWHLENQLDSIPDFVLAESMQIAGESYKCVLSRRSMSSDVRSDGIPVAGWSWASNAPLFVSQSDTTLAANHHCLVISSGKQQHGTLRPAYSDSLFVGVFQETSEKQGPWDVLPLLLSIPLPLRTQMLIFAHWPHQRLQAFSVAVSINHWLLGLAATNRQRREKLGHRNSDARQEIFRSLLAAKSYVHSNLSMDLSLDDIAHSAKMSRSHFCRQFREVFDISPTAYLSEVRFQRAVSVICESNSPLHKVLADVGLSSVPSFCRAFRSRYGASSEAFRGMVRKDNESLGNQR
jgi:AraC-like DNA-binding protein